MKIKIGKYYITKNNPREFLKKLAILEQESYKLKKQLKELEETLSKYKKIVGGNKEVSSLIDKMEDSKYLYIPGDEHTVKELLIGHSIKRVDEDTLQLDNGIKLRFIENDGCTCGSGAYDITELNECNNIITNVEFETEEIGKYEDLSYKLFVYSENKKIKLLQCDGNDGDGYYGTGYHIDVMLEDILKYKEIIGDKDGSEVTDVKD